MKIILIVLLRRDGSETRLYNKLYNLSYAEAKIIEDKLDEDYFNSIASYRRVLDPSVLTRRIKNWE